MNARAQQAKKPPNAGAQTHSLHARTPKRERLRLHRTIRRNHRLMKIQITTRSSRATLTLVTVTIRTRTIRMLSRATQTEETQLTNLRTRPQHNRQSRHIRQLKRHMPRKTRINKTSRRVSQKTQTTQRRLTLQAGSHIIRQRHLLIRRTQHKLTRMQNKRLIRSHLNQARQILLRLSRINMRVLMVIEQTEETINPHVHTCRLNHRLIERIKNDAPISNLLTNIAI